MVNFACEPKNQKKNAKKLIHGPHVNCLQVKTLDLHLPVRGINKEVKLPPFWSSTSKEAHIMTFQQMWGPMQH